MERTLKNVDYRIAPTKCEECHEDIHGSQFSRKGTGVTLCVGCHTEVKWNPTIFDHEKTIFSLKDAHENVRCKSCHANFNDVNGKSVLFYKPTPTACSACHGTTLKNTVAQNARP
jgi:predicted CXXCH cytochrome family protein